LKRIGETSTTAQRIFCLIHLFAATFFSAENKRAMSLH